MKKINNLNICVTSKEEELLEIFNLHSACVKRMRENNEEEEVVNKLVKAFADFIREIIKVRFVVAVSKATEIATDEDAIIIKFFPIVANETNFYQTNLDDEGNLFIYANENDVVVNQDEAEQEITECENKNIA